MDKNKFERYEYLLSINNIYDVLNDCISYAANIPDILENNKIQRKNLYDKILNVSLNKSFGVLD